MQSVDGDVRLSVSMDTSDVRKDTQALKHEIDSIFKSGPEGSVKFETLKNQMKQTANKASELSSKLSSIKSSQVPTQEYAQLEKTLAKAESAFDELYTKQEQLQSAGISYGKEWDAIQRKMERVSATVETTRNKMKSMRTAGTAYTPGIDTPEYSKVNAQLDATNDKMRLLINRHAELKSATDKSNQSIKASTKLYPKLGKSAHKAGLNIGRMIKTSIVRMFLMRFVLMGTIRSIITGFTNLAQYSNETNANLSALKSSLTQLKNSLATAFAPILNVITPILVGFINTLSKVINTIGMFIAALTGKGTFTKAVAVQENFAGAMGDTAGATKEAAKAQKTYLSGLDEVTRFESDKDSGGAGGGGAGGGGISPSQMFEEIQIPSSLTNLANTVKNLLEPVIALFKNFGIRIKEATVEWWNNLDWTPLKLALFELVEAFTPLLDIILNGLAWAYEEVLLPLGKWTIEKGLPKTIQLLGKAFKFVATVLDTLNPLFNWLWQKCLKPFGKLVLDVTEDILDAFGDLLDFITNVLLGDWEGAFNALKSIVSDLGDAIDKVFNFIENSILKPFDDFLQKVFATDWIYWFGVLGHPIQALFNTIRDIWNGIKRILQGVMDFIAGVFTGNWSRAWNGIKNIFSGVWKSMVGVVKAPINTIIGCINGMISGVVQGVNAVIRAINRIHFTVPRWIPGLGGKSVGFHLSSVSAPRIPYLAQGAVIPPNSPFLAMLGDQKRGTNIEAPLDTIKQAVAEVLANKSTNGGSYEFVAQINRRTLFDEVIDEAKLRQTVTSTNPFLLGKI